MKYRVVIYTADGCRWSADYSDYARAERCYEREIGEAGDGDTIELLSISKEKVSRLKAWPHPALLNG